MPSSRRAALSVALPDAKMPQALAIQVSLMLSKAVANAVRHGQASNIDVVMKKSEAPHHQHSR